VTVGAKAELQELVDLLSDYECEQLVHAVSDVAGGERFWEGDVGHFYNEYVKLRLVNIQRRRPMPTKLEKSGFVPLSLVKTFPHVPRVPLAPSQPLTADLAQALRSRRSRREYADTTLGIDELSALLWHAAGITGFADAYGMADLPLRVFPSHGGLQAPEVYLAVRAVDGIAAGIYHYHVRDHALEAIGSGDPSQRLRELTFDEAYVERAAVVVAVSGCYDRLRWKYGERAYRFMCMDAGFLGQSLYLVTEGLGLAGSAISGFAQDEVESLFGVDGKSEIVLMLFTVGVKDGASGGH
jgi:SagB-type dehydrogenase family enzyme